MILDQTRRHRRERKTNWGQVTSRPWPPRLHRPNPYIHRHSLTHSLLERPPQLPRLLVAPRGQRHLKNAVRSINGKAPIRSVSQSGRSINGKVSIQSVSQPICQSISQSVRLHAFDFIVHPSRKSQTKTTDPTFQSGVVTYTFSSMFPVDSPCRTRMMRCGLVMIPGGGLREGVFGGD